MIALEAVDDSLLVYQGGEVNFEFGSAAFKPDEFASGQSVRVILVSKADGRYLVCVPGGAWHRLVAQRVLPQGAISRAVKVEIQACREDDRASAGEDTVVAWLGLLNPDLLPLLVKSVFEEEKQDVDFDPARFPFGEALVQVSQDHFTFFSAGEDGPETQDADVGSQDLSGRVSSLEDMMQKVNANLESLVQMQQGHSSFQLPTSKAAPQRKSALKKPQSQVSQVPLQQGEEGRYPDLDPGVVAAAIHMEQSVLEEMQSLMTKNVKGAQALRQNKVVPQANVLSDSEEEGGADSGAAGGSSDLVGSALNKLTILVDNMTKEKKQKRGTSKLELALDGAFASGANEPSASTGGKKSAVARRALRATLQDSPEEIYALVEKLMAEDVYSQTVAPGMSELTSFSARGWLEHRSRVGPYKAAAHSAWGVAGILDSLRAGKTAAARARACLLLLQIDQSSVDRGNWALATELSLELPPPFSSLSQHQPPGEGELPYSRLLDPRWCELAVSHLREQEDYLSKRKGLNKKGSEAEDSSPSPPRRQPKPKPKAKAASTPEA